MERNANNLIDFCAEHSLHEGITIDTHLNDCKIQITATCGCGSQRTFLFFDSWFYENVYVPSLTRKEKKDAT